MLPVIDAGRALAELCARIMLLFAESVANSTVSSCVDVSDMSHMF